MDNFLLSHKVLLINLTVRLDQIVINHLRQLAIFAKTIDHGSFRGAAQELRLSPSVVSHHIAQLEDHLGVALIYRTTRKLSLTLDGERLLAATRKMLEAVEGELSGLSASAGEPSGELRITAPSMLSDSILVDSLAHFQRSYPKVRLNLDFSDIRRALIEDNFDVAIRVSMNVKNSQTVKRLFRMDRRLVASPEFLQRNPKVKEPAEVQAWDWLQLSPARHSAVTFQKGKKEQLVKPSAVKARCNDAYALCRLARAGAGVAIVPDSVAAKHERDGSIEFLLPAWKLQPVDVYAEWPSNAPKNGLIKLLVGELSAVESVWT